MSAKIYTSYFAQMRNFTEDLCPVAICLYPPKWYTGQKLFYLAPDYYTFTNYKQTHNEEEFTNSYLNMIDNTVNVDNLLSQLDAMCGDKTPVLLCFEKSSDFCHRHLLRQWLNNKGIECKEWKKLET